MINFPAAIVIVSLVGSTAFIASKYLEQREPTESSVSYGGALRSLSGVKEVDPVVSVEIFLDGASLMSGDPEQFSRWAHENAKGKDLTEVALKAGTFIQVKSEVKVVTEGSSHTLAVSNGSFYSTNNNKLLLSTVAQEVALARSNAVSEATKISAEFIDQ